MNVPVKLELFESPCENELSVWGMAATWSGYSAKENRPALSAKTE